MEKAFRHAPGGCRLRRLGVYIVSRYAITMSGIVIAERDTLSVLDSVSADFIQEHIILEFLSANELDILFDY